MLDVNAPDEEDRADDPEHRLAGDQYAGKNDTPSEEDEQAGKVRPFLPGLLFVTSAVLAIAAFIIFGRLLYAFFAAPEIPAEYGSWSTLGLGLLTASAAGAVFLFEQARQYRTIVDEERKSALERESASSD